MDDVMQLHSEAAVAAQPLFELQAAGSHSQSQPFPAAVLFSTTDVQIDD